MALYSSSACFNPRPPLLAGDAPRHALYLLRPNRFNPRPPLLAGDACLASLDLPERCSFNPRPPLLAGDAAKLLNEWGSKLVSIRARHYWRAMLCCDVARLPSHCVSIRARHYWRAMRVISRQAWDILSFQSAPAITGGRCEAPSSNRKRTPCFNPRPPLLAGDATIFMVVPVAA